MLFSLKINSDEHWGARVSFKSGFLGVYAQKWDYWVIQQFYLRIFPPETITTLLIGYTPIQNKEFLKREYFPSCGIISEFEEGALAWCQGGICREQAGNGLN